MPLNSYLAAGREAIEGITVTRADAALPQTTTTTMFTIAGEVELLDLISTVGTVIQTQTDNMTWKWTPTDGSAIDLNTATNITAVAAGGKITLQPLTDAGAVQSLTLTPIGGASRGLPGRPFRLTAGTLAVTMSASNTGTLAHLARYRPAKNGGTIVAA